MRSHNLLALTLLLGMAGASAVLAQPTITAEKLPCVPTARNAVVRITSVRERPAELARLYFRWNEHGTFYWVPAEMEAPGRYWAIPPKPEDRNKAVEYYATFVDATGRETARSQMQKVEVSDDCRVKLTSKEYGVAQNLTIGETAMTQMNKSVIGFLCDGIVTRINSEGVRRSDDVCRACVVAWFKRAAILATPITGLTTVVTIEEPEPVSVAQP
jgi:hypothetical protein